MSERKGEDGTASTYNESEGRVAVPPMLNEDNREGAVPPIVNEGEYESTTTPMADDTQGKDLSPVPSYEPGTDHIDPVMSEGKITYEGKAKSRSTHTIIQCNSYDLRC